jgi:hypothetical protein
VSQLPILASLNNPHFLIRGNRSADILNQLLRCYRDQADFVMLSSRLSPLQRLYGHQAENAERLQIALRVLESAEGLGIALTECARVIGKSTGGNVSIVETARSAVEEMRLGQTWGKAVVNGRKFLLANSPDPERLAEINSFLSMCDLPPLHQEEDQQWSVVVRSVDEGRALSRYGVFPQISEAARQRDADRLASEFRWRFPKASPEAISEAIATEQRDNMWRVAVEAPIDESNDRRIDATGIPLIDAVQQRAELADLRPILADMYAGHAPLGNFTPGVIRFLDAAECSNARRALLLLSVIHAAENQLANGRYSCLIVDDYALPDGEAGFKALEFLIRQGRKYGLCVVLVEHRPGTFPSHVLEVVGNQLGSAERPERLGFPAQEERRRLLGMANLLSQHLHAHWRNPIPLEISKGFRPTYVFGSDLNLGELIVGTDDIWWRDVGASQWATVPDVSIGLRSSGLSPQERQNLLAEGLRLLGEVRAAYDAVPKSQFWWYPVATGRSVALTVWD